ncbi:MAG: hypothetical protein E7411_00285 [Ruminococcaceae bacterium]|nr:hypothetical protein [Oscillospiraceae bacterium]
MIFMKLKRSLSVLLMFTVMLSTITFAIPTYAADVEEPFIDYVYYDDFSTTEKMNNYATSINFSNWNNIYDEGAGTFASNYSLTSDKTLEVKGTGVANQFIYTKLQVTASGKPKLIVSFDVKPKFTSSSGYRFGTRNDNYGTSTIGIYDNSTAVYAAFYNNETTDKTYTKGQWMNVTLIYDNDSEKANNRDIYINGQYAGTYISTATQASSNYNYSKNGTLWFAPGLYGKTADAIEYDNIEIYGYPTQLKYEVDSASGKEIKVNFNMIPNADTILPENFTVFNGENELTVSKAEISPVKPKQIVLTLNENLQPGNTYSVTAEGLTAGTLTSTVSDLINIESKELIFETKPLKIYAENLKLYDDNGEVSTLSDGTYKVKTTFINESEEVLSPVIAAGLYDENNELKSLQLIPVTDPTQPIEEDITLSNTTGLTLKLFMLKSKTSPETVSAVSVYTETSKDTDKVFDPEVKMLRDNFDIETVVNGDTQVITTKVDTFTNDMARPATLIVLKKGKTLSDIDLTNPMATVVALDSAVLTEDGISYKIPDVKDDYEAYIYLKNSDNFGYKTFIYYGKAFIDEGKEIVKDIVASEVDSFIQNYKDAISLDTSVYDTLTGSDATDNDDKDIVAKSIEAQRKEKSTKKFASFEEFISAFNQAIEFAQMKTNADVKEMINKLPESDCTALYEDTISDDAINAVHQELISKKPLTMNEFEKEFNKNVILKGIEKSENYTQAQTIMENTDEITNVDLSVYNILKDKKPVNVAINKKAFADYTLLNNAFESAAKAQRAKELAGGLPSGSVGGGGGGKGTAVVPSPMDKTEIAIEPEIKEEPIVPVIPSASAKEFKDLSGFDWAKDAINNLASKGIVNGVSDSSFNPGGEVKREEFVKMIDTLYTANAEVSEFTDVNQNEWYAPFINKSVSAGIVKGMSDTVFGLGKGVTREDMAVMILRALKLEANTSGDAFSDDSEISSYAKEAVYILRSKGIISGTGNGNFEPKRIMTRAEAAVLINNILNIKD